MPDENECNDWRKWSKHVLLAIERFDKSINNMSDKIENLHIDVSALKIKAGVWGLVGGLIPALIMVLIVLLK